MKTSYKITPIAFTLFLSFFMLTGCGTTSVGKLGTPSGRPEVAIPNTNIQIVMDDVAAWLASQGKPISETSVYTISTTFTRKTLWVGVIPYKSVFTVVQNGANVSVYGATIDERNGDEQREQTDYDEMQTQLTQIAGFIKTRSNSQITK